MASPNGRVPLYPGHDARNHSVELCSSAARPPRPFDADRYLNWRLFYDYSGGNCAKARPSISVPL